MGETVKEAVKSLKENPLVEFAVGAGTAAIVVSICWAVVKILQLILT